MDAPFHVRQAREAGFTPGRLRSRDFDAPFHGIRVVAGAPLDIEQLCRAYAVKMRRDALFSHETAALLRGIPLPSRIPTSPIHVSAPLGTAPIRGRGVVGHHHPAVVRPDLVGGLRVTDAASVWIALGTSLSTADLVAVGDHLVTEHDGSPRACSPEELLAALGERTGCRGASKLRRAAAFVHPGAASRPESLLRVLLESGGMPRPHVNHRIDELRVVIDLAWPDARFGIEYDGAHHRHPAQYAADIQRQERLHDIGWLLMRVTKESLFGDPIPLVRRARSRLLTRGALLEPLRLSRIVQPNS